MRVTLASLQNFSDAYVCTDEPDLLGFGLGFGKVDECCSFVALTAGEVENAHFLGARNVQMRGDGFLKKTLQDLHVLGDGILHGHGLELQFFSKNKPSGLSDILIATTADIDDDNLI